MCFLCLCWRKIRFIQEKSATLHQQDVNGTKEPQRAATTTGGNKQPFPFESCRLQLVAMSATVGNLKDLAHWMGAELFATDFRPIKLVERIVAGCECFDSCGQVDYGVDIVQDKQAVLGFLCCDAIRLGQQILLFCPTKQLCQDAGKQLKGLVSVGSISERVKTERDQLVIKIKANIDSSTEETSAVDKVLLDLIPYGIAFHHSGVGSANRVLIEKGFKSGIVSILAATSTLAAGVNLPAGRVIIKSLKIGRDMLKTSQYKQMVGRAGRPGQTTYGEAFLVVERSELDVALTVVNGKLPNVVSQLTPHKNGIKLLLKAILEIHALNFCQTLSDVAMFVRLSLMYQECPESNFGNQSSTTITRANVMQCSLDATKFLILAHALTVISTRPIPQEMPEESSVLNQSGSGFDLNQQVEITKFGKAVVHCGLNPDEAIVIYEALLKAHDGLDLSNNVHLLYLVTPIDHPLHPDFSKLLRWYDHFASQSTTTSTCCSSGTSDAKSKTDNFFVGKLVGLEEQYGQLVRWSHQPPGRDEVAKCYAMRCSEYLASINVAASNPANTAKKNIAYWNALCTCKRIWGSIFIDELIKGKPMPVLCKEFSIELADALNLQYSIRIMSGRIERLCAELGWKSMEAMCKHIRTVIYLGKSSKCRELLDIPVVTPKLADLLIEFGIQSVGQLAEASVPALVDYIRLKSEFEVQELEYVENQLNVRGNSQRTAENKKGPTRDQEMKHRLACWMNAVVHCAK
jgi:DNA polymerase theta